MLNGDGARDKAVMTRDEALQRARIIVERHPVNPGLLAELCLIIPDEDVLTIWLASNNGWFQGALPVEHLDKREAVLDAAKKAISMDHFWGSSDQWRAYQQQVGG